MAIRFLDAQTRLASNSMGNRGCFKEIWKQIRTPILFSSRTKIKNEEIVSPLLSTCMPRAQLLQSKIYFNYALFCTYKKAIYLMSFEKLVTRIKRRANVDSILKCFGKTTNITAMHIWHKINSFNTFRKHVARLKVKM
jgi:hypothetical protein